MAENQNQSAVVFVHGIMGFESIRVIGRDIVYFTGLAEQLGDIPVFLHFPACPPSGTVKERAGGHHTSHRTYETKLST